MFFYSVPVIQCSFCRQALSKRALCLNHSPTLPPLNIPYSTKILLQSFYTCISNTIALCNENSDSVLLNRSTQICVSFSHNCMFHCFWRYLSAYFFALCLTIRCIKKLRGNKLKCRCTEAHSLCFMSVFDGF